MTRHGVKLAVSLAILGSLMTPQAAAAFGYKDTGFDPDDRKPVGENPDIRSTTRRVWASVDGHGWLTIRLGSYGEMGLYWSTYVRLDTRGGPLADHWMHMWWADQSGRGCWVRPTGSHHLAWGHFYQRNEHASWARCKVPLRAVDPNKRIRWKVLGVDTYKAPPRFDEFAPNHGWYS